MRLKQWVEFFDKKIRENAKKLVDDQFDELFVPDPFNPIEVQKAKKIRELVNAAYPKEEREANSQALILIRDLLPQKISIEEWESVEQEFIELPDKVADYFTEHYKNHDDIVSTPLQDMGGISNKTIEHCYLLARDLIEESHFDDARKILTCMRFFAPYLENLWIAEAICLKLQNQYQECIQFLELAHRVFPDNPQILIHLTECLIAFGDVFHANHKLEEAKKLAKENGSYERYEDVLSLLENTIKESKSER